MSSFEELSEEEPIHRRGGAEEERAERMDDWNPDDLLGAMGLDESATLEVAKQGLMGAPAPLPHLATIQQSFGPAHDLSGVQAFIGGPAAIAAGQMGVPAYARGNQIAFACAPSLHLAAHEAAHVVQQRAGAQLPGNVGTPGDRYEQGADAAAELVVRGESAASILGSPGSEQSAANAPSVQMGYGSRLAMASRGAGAYFRPLPSWGLGSGGIFPRTRFAGRPWGSTQKFAWTTPGGSTWASWWRHRYRSSFEGPLITSPVEPPATEPEDGDNAGLAPPRESVPEERLARILGPTVAGRLLRVFPSSELDNLSAVLAEPAKLAVMVEHLGEANTRKLVRQWIGEGSIAKANSFLQRLSSAVGEQHGLEPPALENGAYILDTNFAIAVEKDKDRSRWPEMNQGEKARAEYVARLSSATDFRVANVSLGEFDNLQELKTFPLTTSRDSSEYLTLLKKLEDAKVGGTSGFADRSLVADAFFAKTKSNDIPRLLTSDANVIKRLAKLARIDLNDVGGYGGLVKKYGDTGFNVTINGRTITVIPSK